MSGSQYILAVRGRKWPVCIEADRFDYFDGDARFFKGDDLVAVSGALEFFVRADALAPHSASAGHLGGEAIVPRVEHLEPGEAMRVGNAVMAQSLLPLWPVLAGSAIGFIAGAGAVLSHIGAW